MRNTKAQQEEELKRLREEIAMLGRMNHPNIVRCLGATQHEGHINIFIEWMAGERVGRVWEDERRGGKGQTSLVPRPSPAPVFDCKRSKTGAGEGLGTSLGSDHVSCGLCLLFRRC